MPTALNNINALQTQRRVYCSSPARRPPKPKQLQSAPAAPLIVLGYDEHHKPRAARFPATDAALVAKAAQLMDLKPDFNT
jgi:hypothetical protein